MEKLANRSWPPVGDLTLGRICKPCQMVSQRVTGSSVTSKERGEKCNFNEMDRQQQQQQTKPPSPWLAWCARWRMTNRIKCAVITHITKNPSPSLLLSPFKLNSSFSFHFIFCCLFVRSLELSLPLHHFFFTPAYLLDWTTEWAEGKQKIENLSFFFFFIILFVCSVSASRRSQ